ncbi:MAG: MFS transporter [Brevundimonas sp.]|jgi:MFS family permease|uniref:MFS transporter n=1 Tax=Brevundimonas sp. TaxID=1871086 RepID=UPI00391A1359
MNLRALPFGLLFLVSLVAGAGSMALQSVLPAIGREFGLPDTLVAGAFAISALIWTLTSPVWARLSDTVGRKRIIMVGLGGFTASMLCFGLAVTAGLEGWLPVLVAFVAMAAARSLYGVFGSASPIAAQAYVADRTSRAQRTRALSLLASGQGLGTVLGPALAPFFVLPLIGLAGPMYAFAALGLIVLWAVWRHLPSGEVERKPTEGARQGRHLWRDARVRDFLLFGLLVTSVQAANMSVLGFHVIDELGLPAREAQSFIGIAMLAGAAATLMAQWGLIPLLRMQPPELMKWGVALALAGNALSLVAPGYFGVVVSYALVSLGFGFARPGFTAGSSIAVGPSEQGAIAGLMMMLAGLSFLAPPVLGVGLYELAEHAPFIANVLVLLVALWLAFTRASLSRHGGDPPSTSLPPASLPPASRAGP